MCVCMCVSLCVCPHSGDDSRDGKAVLVGCLLVMCSIIELGQAGKGTTRIDQDSFEHITLCIRVLADPLANGVVGKGLRDMCKASYHKLLQVCV